MSDQSVNVQLKKPFNKPLQVVKRHVLYKQGPMIGQGAFGVVYKASEVQRPGKSVAIKQMKSRGGVGVPQDAYREIKILKELSRFPHDNIVRLERVLRVSDSKGGIALNLVYGYAEHDLSSIVRTHRTRNVKMDERVIKSMLWQLLKGVKFLHENWVMHRDIKPANILITDAQSISASPGTLLLADFGLARVFQSPLRSLSLDGDVVTIWYRAPELLMGSKHYTRAIDVWAVGCIFAELMLCHAIFPGTDVGKKETVQVDQLEKIFQVLGKPTEKEWPEISSCLFYPIVEQWKKPSSGIGDFKMRIGDILGLDKSSPAYDLLLRMLDFNPSKRITAEEALEHSYFKTSPFPNENVFLTSKGVQHQYPTRDEEESFKRPGEIIYNQSVKRRREV